MVKIEVTIRLCLPERSQITRKCPGAPTEHFWDAEMSGTKPAKLSRGTRKPKVSQRNQAVMSSCYCDGKRLLYGNKSKKNCSLYKR